MNSELFKQRAERLYPYKVDITVPPEGLGKRLDQMFNWLGCDGLRIPVWDQHGHSEPGNPPKHFARFYFVSEKQAKDFEKEFGQWARKAKAALEAVAQVIVIFGKRLLDARSAPVASTRTPTPELLA
ncbi:MAG: hypothetical protein QNJ30_09140 [Kiloniellales bacterium]|nr:hypothetical protein [Kiloniellales bacterium]